MDTEAACEKASLEQARESLIGISYSIPDKVLTSPNVTENMESTVGLTVKNDDTAEKYRSELISISYSHSPDVEVSPIALEDQP